MNKLLNFILKNNKNTGLIEVDKLSYNMISSLKNKLKEQGYSVSNLSDRQVSILFFALTDILFIVKDDSFYLATLCMDKIYELKALGRIIPFRKEHNFEKTAQLLRNNTVDVINQYLDKGKFHLIKLNQLASCTTSFTLVSLSGMNPYPDLSTEKVYCLSNVADWYHEISDTLIRGSYKLLLDDGFELCTSYLQRQKGICTGGYILTNDLSYNPVQVPVWKVKSYEPYSDNSLIQSLLTGVVDFDGNLITLNRDLLMRYYGRDNYLKLESKGVRYRLCLEELLSSVDKYQPGWYRVKYNLDIYDCETIAELQSELRSRIKWKKPDNFISVRNLYSYNSIVSGNKNYYRKIDLTALDKHKIKVVDDVVNIMPKEYDYYAVSGMGYLKVTVSATSDNLALKYGKTEFERQFGEEKYFCSLVTSLGVVKGMPVFKIGMNIQRHLCQGIMWGYSQNYEMYSKDIKTICSDNNIQVTDEYIQFLYVNNLAREHKYAGDIPFPLVAYRLVEFLSKIKVRVDAEKALISELEKVVYPKVVSDYKIISDNLSDYSKNSTIKTDNAVYKLNSDGKLSKKVDLYFRGRYLCSRLLK